jgi:hypothetical protein
MRLLATFALATLLAACSDSPCQELGEKLCACTGLSSDSCKTQVEDDLKRHEMSDATCDTYLGTCNAPEGADFCEWLLTEDGKRLCGIAIPP